MELNGKDWTGGGLRSGVLDPTLIRRKWGKEKKKNNLWFHRHSGCLQHTASRYIHLQPEMFNLLYQSIPIYHPLSLPCPQIVLQFQKIFRALIQEILTFVKFFRQAFDLVLIPFRRGAVFFATNSPVREKTFDFLSREFSLFFQLSL